MSNQRASNQTLIAIAVHRKLLHAMDHACSITSEDRSTFIRQAIVNIIKQRNGVVQDEWVRAQVRARGNHKYETAPVAPAAKKPAKPAKPAASKSRARDGKR